MADKDVKLKATIEGDSKNLQSALNDAQKSATSASKKIEKSVEGVKGSFDSAGASARDMGATASKATMTIGEAMRHPIEAIKQLIAKLREAKQGMNQLGEAGKKAGQGSKDVEQALGSIVGIGSKFAVIAKGFQVIKEAIYLNVIKPIAEAYKETQRLANVSATKAGKHDTEVDDLKQKQKALLDYWQLYQSIQDKLKNNTASSEEKEQERQARRNLERYHNVKINPRENVENQVIEQLDISQIEVGFALDKKIAELEKAISKQKRAVKEFDTPVNRGTYGLNGDAFERDKDALVEKQYELEAALKKAKAAREMARVENPAEDLYRMNRAKEGDAFGAGKAKAQDEEQKSAEAEAKARLEVEKARQKATEALDRWASDLMDDESKKRLDEAYDKYASLVEQGVSEELAKPVLDEAIRQELSKTVEKEAEARKKLVEEYQRQRENLQSAYERQAQAQQALTDAQKRLADLQRQQAEDARLERIGRKRGKIATRLARFGFQLGNVNPNETTRQHNARIRTAKLDSSIRQKLAKQEAGGRVHYTTREKERMGEYRRLERQDRRLNREEQAILAARKQVSASEALKSASDAINTAAGNLQQATKGVETQRATTLQAKQEAQAQAQKETEAKARAEKGYERGAKYSEKATAKPAIKKPEGNVQPLVEAINRLYAPPREWIAKKGEKDQSNALLRGIQKAIEKQSKRVYVVK